MGRKKLQMKKIDSPRYRRVTYSKRRDGIVKKATELSVLCDIGVGLLMFSPTGQLTSFASNGRVEDIFLRYIDCSDELRGGLIENEEFLNQNLRHLKYEGEMLEKIAKIEALEEKFHKLNQRQHEAEDKMRFYNPDLKKIISVHEAQVHQKFLVDAIRHVEQLKVKLLGKQIATPKPESIEIHAVVSKDADVIAEEYIDSEGKGIQSRDEYHGKACLPVGPHLTIGYLKTQRHWDLQGGCTPRLNINQSSLV